MAKYDSKKDPQGEPEIKPISQVVLRNITEEMRESYLDYAMSVITSRALPDVRDGLKPVQRRILYVMHELGLTAGAKFRKCAKIAGDTSGNYHPHGEGNVYGALVNLAQDFSMRHPLVDGQGNFGSIDGDPPAAMRYTEARMSRLSSEMLRDIEKNSVDFRANYDGTTREPVVLPAGFPNLLVNGALGIAVGMATNIPPHNLREVIDATVFLIDNPEATTEDLMEHVHGPDFPTGGVVFNVNDINHAYANGKGGVVVRGIAEIEEDNKGNPQIIVKSIPYRVNKSDLIMKIADLVREKKLEGVRGLRDESTDDIRIVIELKSGSHPQNVLNYLYRHTQLEDTFHYNLVALVNGVPQTLTLKGVLEEFILFREEVVRRRTAFDLEKARDREHILLGLKKALDHIDEIIKLIKASKDTPTAHAGLMKTFKFSDRQATAILEMKLQRLAGLERQKIEDDLLATQALIKELELILASKKKMRGIIKAELSQISEKYGEDRKTKVVKGGAKIFSVEDLIADEENVLVLTAGGYIKRTNPNEYRQQKRGGVGVVDLNTKEEDFVTTLLTTSTHSDLLFFTDAGKVYQTKMYDVPEGRRATRGKSIMNFLPLSSEEKITSILPMPKNVKGKDLSVFMITKDGVAKRVSAESFFDVRRSGIIAIKLTTGDQLISASFVGNSDSVSVVTNKGQSIHFKSGDIREMGRNAAGVRGIKLGKGDRVIGAYQVSAEFKNPTLLVLTLKGYGKQTPIKEYKIQKRGGSGIKTAKVTAKTGEIVAAWIVTEETDEIVAMSKKAQVIRTSVSEIPKLGRQTQGVRVMKLHEGDAIASLICL